MELEFHQLDLRYDGLRVRQPARERWLLASLTDVGQQMPIAVVTSESQYLVVDGHKRVRCLHRLHRDTVAAVLWAMAAWEALIFRHLLQTDATENVFEQAWLLRTLHEEHGLALDVVARRFDRSVSWVSRRLSLVRTLRDTVQQHVREGRIAAHAAMKYLVPLARQGRRLHPFAADREQRHRYQVLCVGCSTTLRCTRVSRSMFSARCGFASADPGGAVRVAVTHATS
jgi:ParB-like chromosome segregation protein Spo0J